MATSGAKFEALISGGFPAADRFRLQVRKVVMAPGDSLAHAHEDAGLCIVHTVPLRSHGRARQTGTRRGIISSKGVTSPIRSRRRLRWRFGRST
jgi:hypothetical protein